MNTRPRSVHLFSRRKIGRVPSTIERGTARRMDQPSAAHCYLGRGTIANVLKREGIEPAPERGGRTPWSVFLTAHWRSIVCDTKYTAEFRRLIAESRTAVSRLPPPNLNAYAEHFVRSIKKECLDRMIFVGQASLRRAVAEFVVHIVGSAITWVSAIGFRSPQRHVWRLKWQFVSVSTSAAC